MVQRVGQAPFITGGPFQEEIQDLERQKRMAELLTQKGMETPQGQIVGGRFVKPSWSQYANQMLSAYLGGAESRDVARQQQELANKLRMQGAQETQGILEALSGRPAQQQVLGTEVPQTMLPQGQTAISDEGTPTLVQPALEAVKPNAGLALARALSAQTPQAQMIGQELLKQAFTPQKIGEGESLVTRDIFGTGGYTPIATGAAKEPTEYKEYLKAKEGGFQGSFFDYQRALKQAGAQPINVSMGKDFAGQVGDIVRESAGMARAAQQTVQSADKIINAADKAITGKGAEVRLTATQLADTLGIGGKDKEKLEKAQNLWKLKNAEKVKQYQRVTNLKKFGLSIILTIFVVCLQKNKNHKHFPITWTHTIGL